MQLPAALDSTVANVYHTLHRVGRVPALLLLLWLATIWWGERAVFEQSAARCEWQKWESWSASAEPHHVLLIADPQLVDPHTYPGRPWPLSTLTIWITDLYMRRTYHYLLYRLQPHTTLFLGDLFDGGREWATTDYKSPETRYKEYGTSFWLREYKRFMDMFIEGWHNHDLHSTPSKEGRRIVASLPGNHDLGFASGINDQVKDRFDAHFGPLNRIDVIGNHTFVSIDTVSLSAMDEPDPSTGSSGAGDGTTQENKLMEIWRPAENFLENVKSLRARAVQQRYQWFSNSAKTRLSQTDDRLFSPVLLDIDDAVKSSSVSPQDSPAVSSSNFPTILLSHVPLYRDADVSCGPMRERGTSIPLSAGYQYQNVLKPVISSDIVKHLDADQVTMIYSGDDHDYCEIEHGEFTGRIKEITVKSTSMAMGVQRPGVQLASLWNPIDMKAIAKGQTDISTPRDTVQNHLCLLPFMEGILLRYLEILIFTLVILAVRAARYNPQHETYPSASKPRPLLPLSRKVTPPHSPKLTASDSNTSSTLSTSARARTLGKSGGYGNLPASSRSASPAKDDWNDTRPRSSSYPNTQHGATSGHGVRQWLGRSSTRTGEFFRSIYILAGPVLLFYICLLWRD